MGISDKEQAIVALLEAHDRRAAKELYNAYAGYLSGVCARYVCDNDDMRDVLQESFINIFAALASFRYRGPGSLKAWLTKVVVNQSLCHLREACRFSFIGIDNVGIDDVECEAPEEEEINAISQSEIAGLIRSLPVGYRTILNLYLFEGKSHKEIAGMLGIKENTSASQYHRGKALLAKKIKEYVTHNNAVIYGR